MNYESKGKPIAITKLEEDSCSNVREHQRNAVSLFCFPFAFSDWRGLFGYADLGDEKRNQTGQKGNKGIERIFEHDQGIFNAQNRRLDVADYFLDFIDTHLEFGYKVIHVMHQILNADTCFSELK